MTRTHSYKFQLIAWIILGAFSGCQTKVDHETMVHDARVKIFRIFEHTIRENSSKINLPAERILKILETDTNAADVSLQELNAIAQATFLRPSHTERYENRTEEARARFGEAAHDPRLLELFRKVGDRGDIIPTTQTPDYLIIYGATVKNMRKQIQVANEFVSTGALKVGPTSTVVFLSGDRDLFSEKDEGVLLNPDDVKIDPSWTAPVEFPKNEVQAAKFIWRQMLLCPELRSASITFIDAPKNTIIDSKTGEKKFTRPTTSDTVYTWITKYNPKPGTCLSIITQPFGRYRKKIMEGMFKKFGLKDFSIDVAGKDGYFTEKAFYDDIAIFLDNLARTIYAECTI